VIAATADLAARPLATSNVRHFPMFADLGPAH
jgi:predicted nucleic acid-binding protein